MIPLKDIVVGVEYVCYGDRFVLKEWNQITGYVRLIYSGGQIHERESVFIKHYRRFIPRSGD